MAAAHVGGIMANATYPADFLSHNLRIQLNVIDAALATGVDRLLFLGSSCIYPKFAQQPISEESLLTGPLEPTNDAYAIAKIAGVMQVQAMRRQHGVHWISAMPTNLYGPGDNFDPRSSHVIPALIRRCEEARLAGAESITCWGTGRASREFLYVEDCAEAIARATERYDGPEPVNVGSGEEITIRELTERIAALTGFNGELLWDERQPDGQPRRRLDTSRARDWFDFEATTPLDDGLRRTIDWFRAQPRDPGARTAAVR
jgi:GDP-L-fucose synthase